MALTARGFDEDIERKLQALENQREMERAGFIPSRSSPKQAEQPTEKPKVKLSERLVRVGDSIFKVVPNFSKIKNSRARSAKTLNAVKGLGFTFPNNRRESPSSRRGFPNPSTPRRSYSQNGTLQNTDVGEVLSHHQQMKRQALIADAVKNRKLSANTREMLARLGRIQNKSLTDVSRSQRILREQRLLAEASDILKTPAIFTNQGFDILNMQDNILTAPNLFKEQPENNILRPKRLNILQTREAGNNLFF